MISSAFKMWPPRWHVDEIIRVWGCCGYLLTGSRKWNWKGIWDPKASGCWWGRQPIVSHLDRFSPFLDWLRLQVLNYYACPMRWSILMLIPIWQTLVVMGSKKHINYQLHLIAGIPMHTHKFAGQDSQFYIPLSWSRFPPQLISLFCVCIPIPREYCDNIVI